MKLRPIIKDKKGSIVDGIVWVIVAFVTVVFLGLLLFTFGKIKDVFNQIPNTAQVNMTKIVDSTMDQAYDGVANNIKWFSYMLLFAMIISIFIHNYLIKVHPAFLILYLVLAVSSVVVAVPLSNAYEKLVVDPTIGPTLQSFGGATYIMLYLPIFALVIGLVGLIFLFAGIMFNQGEGGSIDLESSII